MITSYATLKTQVASYLHRSDLTTTIIPEAIASGEERIYNDLRIASMEAAYSQAIVSGKVTMPTGFLEWKSLYVDTNPVQKLERRDVEWIYTNYPFRASGGIPKFFAREASNIIFAPAPDSNYTIKGTYYKRLTALSDSNTSNWFIENAPYLLLYASLCECAGYTQDKDNIDLWEKRYEMLAQRLKNTDRRESGSGSILTVKAG